MKKFLALLVFVALVAGCATPEQAPRYQGNRVLMYSVPNLWYTMSSREMGKMADAMAENGWNGTFAEFNPGASWLGEYSFPSDDDAIKKAEEFYEAMADRNIFVVWSYNWNNASLSHWSEQKLHDFMWRLPNGHLAGFEVGEWDCSRNRDTTARAQKCEQWASERFPYWNFWNKGCRPSSAPAGYEYGCVHLAHAKDSLPGGARFVACTDHSLILDELGQGGRDFQKWDLGPAVAFGVAKAKKGNSLHFYHFMGQKYDEDMLKQGPMIIRDGGIK